MHYIHGTCFETGARGLKRESRTAMFVYYIIILVVIRGCSKNIIWLFIKSFCLSFSSFFEGVFIEKLNICQATRT